MFADIFCSKLVLNRRRQICLVIDRVVFNTDITDQPSLVVELMRYLENAIGMVDAIDEFESTSQLTMPIIRT